ncbi:hypothetical protein V6x_63270 [Gimesia chilikensis]|uniref:Uncharacterized protein n=1 Tax=Gimesia chilikensis TaxID=2605989 RepID=A0A517WMV7_9PLAN|nr:hypothetical protein [Gimesia chilikensis]QDU06573.1 hypothetical protein V6x_63270 [Gimesia chilikensis]
MNKKLEYLSVLAGFMILLVGAGVAYYSDRASSEHTVIYRGGVSSIQWQKGLDNVTGFSSARKRDLSKPLKPIGRVVVFEDWVEFKRIDSLDAPLLIPRERIINLELVPDNAPPQ